MPIIQKIANKTHLHAVWRILVGMQSTAEHVSWPGLLQSSVSPIPRPSQQQHITTAVSKELLQIYYNLWLLYRKPKTSTLWKSSMRHISRLQKNLLSCKIATWYDELQPTRRPVIFYICTLSKCGLNLPTATTFSLFRLQTSCFQHSYL